MALTITPQEPQAPHVSSDVLRARETAVIRVNQLDFYNWESVYVEKSLTQPYPIFRFTSAEDTPPPGIWTSLQFKPADECAIYLGGLLTVTGVITARQTSYNATSHGVMLQGFGLSIDAAKASHKDKDGNFDGMTFTAIVNRVLAPFRTKGIFLNVPEEPFKTAQINPGEQIWDFFERLARDVGVIVGSDSYGNFTFVGNHKGEIRATLVEGVNILTCQAIISVENFYSEFVVRAQQTGDDQTYGPAAAEQEATAPGRLQRYSPIIIPADHPVTDAMLKLRAYNEAKWYQGRVLEVTIGVQGWFRPDYSALWQPGDDVMLISPSAMINQVLKVEKVVFSQGEEQGTLTQLLLVQPWALNDQAFSLPEGGLMSAPEAAKSTHNEPATTPPEVPPATIQPEH